MAEWLLAVDETGGFGSRRKAVCVAGLLMASGVEAQLEAALAEPLRSAARFVPWPLHAAHDGPMAYALHWAHRAAGNRELSAASLEAFEAAGVPLPADPRTATEAELREALGLIKHRAARTALGYDQLLLALVEVAPDPQVSDPVTLNHGRAAMALTAAAASHPEFADVAKRVERGARCHPAVLEELKAHAVTAMGGKRWAVETLHDAVRFVTRVIKEELRAHHRKGRLFPLVGTETERGDAAGVPVAASRYRALLRVLLERAQLTLAREGGPHRVRLEVQDGQIQIGPLRKLARAASGSGVSFEPACLVQYKDNPELSVAHVAADRLAYRCLPPLRKSSSSLARTEASIEGRIGASPRRGELSLVAAHGVAEDALAGRGAVARWALEQIPWWASP